MLKWLSKRWREDSFLLSVLFFSLSFFRQSDAANTVSKWLYSHGLLWTSNFPSRPHLVYAVVGIQPRFFCMLGKPSTSQATSPRSPSNFRIYKLNLSLLHFFSITLMKFGRGNSWLLERETSLKAGEQNLVFFSPGSIARVVISSPLMYIYMLLIYVSFKFWKKSYRLLWSHNQEIWIFEEINLWMNLISLNSYDCWQHALNDNVGWICTFPCFNGQTLGV